MEMPILYWLKLFLIQQILKPHSMPWYLGKNMMRVQSLHLELLLTKAAKHLQVKLERLPSLAFHMQKPAIGKATDAYILCYPNAGPPGTPEWTGQNKKGFSRDSLMNVIGECSGPTQYHIREVVEAVDRTVPRNRKRTLSDDHLLISDLEPLKMETLSNFVNIGERWIQKLL